MKNIFTLIFGILIFTTSCKSQTDTHVDFKMNDDIPKDIKSDIDKLNDKIFKSIESLNADLFYNEVLSDTLKLKGGNDLKSIIYQFNMMYDKKGYNIKDEFYIPKVDDKKQIALIADRNTDYEYLLDIGIGSVNTYISLLTFNDDAIMLGLIFREYGDEWKLYFFGAGQYSIKGKLPFEFYKTAKSKYEKGYIVDAGTEAFLANQGLTPNNFFRYTKHQEISDFTMKLDSTIKADYIFPITLENIKTKPKILQISPQTVEEGIFPMVRYLTEIPFSDTIRLKKENDLIQKEIGVIFPGLDKEKKYIFYTAMDRLVTGGTANNVYGFIQNIEE